MLRGMTPTKPPAAPAAPPDQDLEELDTENLNDEQIAAVQRLRELLLVRKALLPDELAAVAAARATTPAVPWRVMGKAFGMNPQWMCQYYKPLLRKSVTVEPTDEVPTGRHRPRRTRGGRS